MDDASAPSLYRWLAQDQDVRRDISFSLGGDGPPEALGNALDVINVVLSNTMAFGSLITSIAAWRGARQKPAKVVIERGDVRVLLETDSPQEVARLVKMLEEDL